MWSEEQQRAQHARDVRLIPIWQGPLIEIRKRVAARERLDYNTRHMHDTEW